MLEIKTQSDTLCVPQSVPLVTDVRSRGGAPVLVSDYRSRSRSGGRENNSKADSVGLQAVAESIKARSLSGRRLIGRKAEEIRCIFHLGKPRE